MTDLGLDVLSSPENAAHARRGRHVLNKPPDRPSHGWSPSDRAPRLRRRADFIESLVRLGRVADREKALRLARDMRIRAQQIESGNADELATALGLFRLQAHDFAPL